jgi:hypothetical protein
MLPTSEIDTLTMTVTDAVDAAADGELAAGYNALVVGLKRAEEIAAEVKDEDISWEAKGRIKE